MNSSFSFALLKIPTRTQTSLNDPTNDVISALQVFTAS